MKRARYQRGTVDADPRTRKLYFRWYEKSGKRRAEYVGDFSSPKRLVEAATQAIRHRINAGESEQTERVSSLVERWKREKMSDRFSLVEVTRVAFATIFFRSGAMCRVIGL